MPRLAKDEFRADFLWELVYNKRNISIYDSIEIECLYQSLFPGIKLSYFDKYYVLVKYCIPVIEKQFPELLNCLSLEDVEKKYSKIIKLKEERVCNGYEWISWE